MSFYAKWGARSARLLVACSVAFVIACATGGGPVPTEGSADPNDFLIVDCRLPPKLKSLGQHSIYATARQVVRTAAVVCRIRGGEYVSYDRANYATALQVWLPIAKSGDPEAQNYVGEIHEKGLGVAPDYAIAISWYRAAAAQGYAPAQINLGQLYEQGRGVTRDPVEAQRWFRQASGLEGLGLEFVSSAAPTSAQDELRSRVEESERKTAALRAEKRELQELRSQDAAERAALAASRERERRELAEQVAGLQRRQREMADREAELAQSRRRMAEQRLELEASRTASGHENSELLAASKTLTERDAQLEASQRELDAGGQVLAVRLGEAAARERALAARELELAQREREFPERERKRAEQAEEIARLSDTIARLETEAAEATALARSLPQAEPSPPEVPVAGPSIQLIDPGIPLQRGIQVAPSIASIVTPSRKRTIVGRVEAAAGLFTLTLNGRDLALSANGLFKHSVEVPDAGLGVTIVAVDAQGKSAQRHFRLVTSVAPDEVVQAGRSEVRKSDIDFGSYHALVIGNDEHANLPDLETAGHDAEAVASLLRSRYDFEVTELRNANRYQILSALNELRSRLDKNDNLLIYYAGHGELDRVNMRGYWLPVDAEAKSTANWISNTAITDILNAMNVRHVLVVADSCYSGALTRSALARLDAGMTDEARETWMKAMVGKRSRTALTSGGLEPVLDSGGGAHSIFARVFLEVLEANRGVLEGQQLFHEVAARVTWAAEGARFVQVPQYAPIKYAGHESGDFFFVPR